MDSILTVIQVILMPSFSYYKFVFVLISDKFLEKSGMTGSDVSIVRQTGEK